MEEKRTIREQLEEVANKICESYCKYAAEVNKNGIYDDVELDKCINEHCENCLFINLI